MPDLSEEIKEGGKVLEIASKPSAFQTLLTVISMLALIFVLVVTERRADAQTAALQAITVELHSQNDLLRTIKEWCCTPIPAKPAVYRER